MLMPGMLQAQNLKDDAGGSQPSHGSTRAGALPSLPGSGGLSVNPALLDQSKEALSRKEQTINNLIRSAESNLAQGETGLALRNYEMAVETGVDRADVSIAWASLCRTKSA